jgi:formylglycine-generating enzyme required for sulfatase activity
MGTLLLRSISMLPLLIASSASAVTMAWTPIGNPGNACDTQPSQGCFGAVGYGYQIATFEVTNAQYTAFLNAVADTDANALYHTDMGTGLGGIEQSGSSGSYTYSATAGREALPVNYVSWYDALRFANWLHNGQLDTGAQTNATTENGSYTFTGTTTVGARNPNATIVLPTEDEWYKAAYYLGSSSSYFDYPAGFDLQTVCFTPSALPNTATCNGSGGGLQDVGSYTGAASPYGTFDQGGNVWEWTETADGATQVMRGGSYATNAANLAAASRIGNFAGTQDSWFGFRVAAVPEPGTGLLVALGLLGLSGWRRSTRG